MSKIWITWEKQRRNLGISAALGFPLYEVVTTKSGVMRYLECTIKTIKLIRNSIPNIVAVQNPSIVLALLGILLKRIYGFTLIVDAHNAGIYPLEGKSFFLNNIVKYIQRSADITVVTNNNLKNTVELNGGFACVLPDRIPKPHCGSLQSRLKSKRICFICTYAKDEPYLEVIKAAEFIPDDVEIVITGKFISKVDPTKIPNNVKLLGYLSEEDFWETMISSDIIMDLTTRENCLVCGAYEGVSLNKPLIISNTEVSRDYFYKGCVYVDSEFSSIAAGIIDAVKRISVLNKEVADLKGELENQWVMYADNLKILINERSVSNSKI